MEENSAQDFDISNLHLNSVDDKFAETSTKSVKYFLCLKVRLWKTILSVSLVAILLMLAGSSGSPRWIQQGENADKWSGGLLKCGGCNGSWEDMYYDEIADDICDLPQYDAFCELYQDLHTGGIIYIITTTICCVTLIIIILFQQKILKLSIFKPRCSGIFLYQIASITHILGLSLWLNFAQASLESNCNSIKLDGSRRDVCITHGPYVAFAVGVQLILTSILYTFIVCCQRVKYN